MKNAIYKLYFVDEPYKVYIGSAKNSDKRLTNHIQELLRGKHKNKLLQIDFNKKGVSMFRWEVIEHGCKGGSLLSIESDYIHRYNSCSKGYNQTQITTSLHSKLNQRVMIPSKYNEYDFSIIEKFQEKYKVNLVCMETTYFKKDSNKGENLFSKSSINKRKKEYQQIINSTYSHIRNVSKKPLKKILCVIDNVNLLDFLKEHEKRVTNRTVQSRVKAFYGEKDKTKNVSEVVVLSNLNPFFLDMAKMSEKDVHRYRVSKLFKLLDLRGHLEKEITLHLPYGLYTTYKNVLKRD